MAVYRFVKKQNFIRRINGFALSIVAFIVILVAFMFIISGISEDTTERQQEALETAIERSIISCYCVEGTYPPSLDYIKDHYGLTYDTDQFFVDYKAIGSNIFPDVTVIYKGDRSDE